MIYYTADTHFCYAPILRDRPFQSVEQMDEALIRNWNSTVSADDTVYVAGDIGYNGGHVPCRILARLQGKKHLIRGNHDTAFRDAPLLFRYFETVTDFYEIDDGGSHVLLSHYPMLYDKGGYMVYGHLHNSGAFHDILKRLPRLLNAGTDVNAYRPVTLRQLIENNRGLRDTPPAARRGAPAEAPGLLPRKADFHPLPQRPPYHRKHLFLTGGKHVGKTTVLRRLLEGRDADIGGFRTVRLIRPEGGAVHMLPPAETAVCSKDNLLFTKEHGVPSIDPGRFDRLGKRYLEGCGRHDLILMDELGPAESEAPAFQQAVLNCLDGPVSVYGVLQEGASGFLQTIKMHPEVQLVTVTEENREQMPQKLLEQGW